MKQDSSVTYTAMIRDLPTEERPRERLKAFGPSALSNTELLAILLRTGVTGESVMSVASRVLRRFQGLAGLARASYSELCSEHGISEAKACQLLAALELGRRYSSLQPEETARISSPRDVANLLMGEMSFLRQEHLRVLVLNTKNQVQGVSQVYIGNVNSAMVRVAEIFKPAITQNCPNVIVVHNHPSGDPTPSADDIAITRQLAGAGKLLDIELLDHVIIGSGNQFFSLKEKGLGF
jgi:DNA repair protein RadC